MHVEEDKAAVFWLAGHEIDKWLNGAGLEVGLSVRVRVMAHSMTDAPDYVAKATQIERTGPHIVHTMEKIVAVRASYLCDAMRMCFDVSTDARTRFPLKHASSIQRQMRIQSFLELSLEPKKATKAPESSSILQRTL